MGSHPQCTFSVIELYAWIFTIPAASGMEPKVLGSQTLCIKAACPRQLHRDGASRRAPAVATTGGRRRRRGGRRGGCPPPWSRIIREQRYGYKPRRSFLGRRCCRHCRLVLGQTLQATPAGNGSNGGGSLLDGRRMVGRPV